MEAVCLTQAVAANRRGQLHRVRGRALRVALRRRQRAPHPTTSSTSGVLSAATQALANVPGFAIAALGALVRQRTGSLLPLFGGIAVFQGLGAIAYTRLATTTVLD